MEKRADELEGKDEHLDDALADLYRVPYQIVRQVLPDTPGELTAGGVHEIRNPLNLVQNFPDGSGELCASNGRNNEDPAAIAYETAGGLTNNLKRFREHGDRANQIVHHMFAMGQRRSGRRPAGNNTLLDVNSQNVGRVILDLVGNACRVAVEKRR